MDVCNLGFAGFLESGFSNLNNKTPFSLNEHKLQPSKSGTIFSSTKMTTSNLFQEIKSQNKPPNKKKNMVCFLKQILCFKFGFSSPQLLPSTARCVSPRHVAWGLRTSPWRAGAGNRPFLQKKGKGFFSFFFLRSILPFFWRGHKNVSNFEEVFVFFSLPSIHFRGLSWKILNRCIFRNGTSLWNFREISGWWNKIWRDFVWTIW